MDFNKDIITTFEEEWEFEGRKFKLKIMNGNEKDKMLDKIIYIDRDTNLIGFKYEDRNRYYLENCVLEAPYTKDGKTWKELTVKERIEILNTLKSRIRVAILAKLLELNDQMVLKKK